MKNPRNLLIFAILGGIVGTGFGYTVRALSAPSVANTQASVSADNFQSHEITEVIETQQKAWNAGDIEGYMRGYWEDELLRFSSGNDVTTGWQATLERYKKRYPNRATMGQLSLDVHEVEKLSSKQALVTGRWKLTRETDAPTGLFTLHMKQMNGAWVIVSDHTSSAH